MQFTSSTMETLLDTQHVKAAINLDALSFDDLEIYKSQLELVRQRILYLQNARSGLLKLPGELRNKIFLLAMYGELQELRKSSRHAVMFRQPAFFAANRQVKAECTGVWLADVLVWEEFDTTSKTWTRMSADQVRAMCSAKTAAGRCKLVTQSAHCDVLRTRDAVEGSRSICSRRGLVRTDTDLALPQLRWWIW
ncbi:hypothetical protein DOTSEDRAFT_69418 [Dothistroma septosporum NZE10]|uniref:F-box domain-containing protein n=1 Tax=Dothistroma septosporum (strain NZE10 / CBS 128990) TaxID=675120 RepID=N1PYJ4_DOTSN|nr:hypothetical protein DOTSEDRAFT_69418 [Dothistroma septosporum NZE10]